MMRNTSISTTVKHYIMTTTLHGFKYLYSTYYVDRLGWMLCFCASACCAGVLCAVLWERFLEVPELLVPFDKIYEEPLDEKIPTVYICPTTESIAEMFLNKFSSNKNITHRIPKSLEQLVVGKPAAISQLMLLDRILAANNVTLPEALMQYSSSCSTYVKRCRYQDLIVPCTKLFKKQQTIWGICCVMNSKQLIKLPQSVFSQTRITHTLDFVLNCTHGHTMDGCQFFTSYDHEENIDAEIVVPGYYYRAQLLFNSIPEKQSGENLVDTSCVSDKAYSRTFCLLECAEEWCGCSDPLHTVELGVTTLPLCSVTQMVCIRASEYKKNITCNCLPSCKRINTFTAMESSRMNDFDYAVIDPIYAKINVSSAIVLNLRVNVGQSRIYHLNPTETWLTLLSSLGGVFNMFLGVGLFSAFEFLFFICVKLPKAIKKSSEIQPSDVRHVHFGRY